MDNGQWRNFEWYDPNFSICGGCIKYKRLYKIIIKILSYTQNEIYSESHVILVIWVLQPCQLTAVKRF